jgi:hypothetical protein
MIGGADRSGRTHVGCFAGGTAGELLNRLKAEELHDDRSNEGNSRTTELRQ